MIETAGTGAKRRRLTALYFTISNGNISPEAAS
jgi:hypothetical protein